MGLDTSLMRSFAVKKKMYKSKFHWKYQKLKEHKYLIQNIFANYAHELCFLPTARNVVLLPLIFLWHLFLSSSVKFLLLLLHRRCTSTVKPAFNPCFCCHLSHTSFISYGLVSEQVCVHSKSLGGIFHNWSFNSISVTKK